MFWLVMSAYAARKFSVGLANAAVKVRVAFTVTPLSVTEVSVVVPEWPQYRYTAWMVVPAGMPVSACTLVCGFFSAQGSPEFDCERSEPPVVTKLMLPVKRCARAIGVEVWASAGVAPQNEDNSAMHKARRHPRPPKIDPRRPRVPRPDGSLMGAILAAHATSPVALALIMRAPVSPGLRTGSHR